MELSNPILLAGLAFVAILLVIVFTAVNKRVSVKNFYLSNNNDINLLYSK